MKVGIFGKGRLGSAIAEAAGADLAWQVGREAPPSVPIDVAIDASAGVAVPAHLAWALERRCNLVIGATGWEVPDLAARVGDRIGVVVAANFSLVVLLLARLARVLGRFAATEPRFDPYLVETHQARKQDAPSGTARMLARVLLEACPRKRKATVPHDGPIAPTDLCVGVVRAGTSASSHTVGLESAEEALRIEHEARSPRAFAEGALAACRWLGSRRGVFTMDDVARDVLDPIFREEAR
jgi:4-hydroxy-tetrahydrodipicolinate reductase